jgi:hypothetical protein
MVGTRMTHPALRWAFLVVVFAVGVELDRLHVRDHVVSTLLVAVTSLAVLNVARGHRGGRLAGRFASRQRWWPSGK